MYSHTPVLLKEVLQALDIKTSDSVIDMTLGGGGYTLAFAESVGKTGRVLSIDLDELSLDNARRLIKERKLKNIVLLKGNFKDVSDLAAPHARPCRIDAIAMDLGLSSAQLDDRQRGFSFQENGPLDMSFEGGSQETLKIVNGYKEEALADIIFRYGEERLSRRIARAIVQSRTTKPIKTSLELSEIIVKAVGRGYGGKIHPATRTFQALRIATNDELKALEQALPQAISLLKPGGRLAVVTFHSLEDRIVKDFFRDRSQKQKHGEVLQPTLKLINKKVITATAEEIKLNPRARSAKLRVVEKM